VAVVVALWRLKVRADAAGLDGNRYVDLTLWLVIWALLGAKGMLVIVELPRYLKHPGDLLGIVRAGGVFLGGFLAAVIALAVLLKRYKLPFFPSTDVIAPSLALGSAIGRIGCLLAGCCWGSVCHEPWAITYTNPEAHANLGTPLNVPVHPFPVYAMLFNLGLYGVLAMLYKRQLAAGRVFATYLLLYGAGRFFLEFFRGDEARGFVLGDLLSTSQLIGSLMVVAGIVLHLYLTLRRRS